MVDAKRRHRRRNYITPQSTNKKIEASIIVLSKMHWKVCVYFFVRIPNLDSETKSDIDSLNVSVSPTWYQEPILFGEMSFTPAIIKVGDYSWCASWLFFLTGVGIIFCKIIFLLNHLPSPGVLFAVYVRLLYMSLPKIPDRVGKQYHGTQDSRYTQQWIYVKNIWCMLSTSTLFLYPINDVLQQWSNLHLICFQLPYDSYILFLYSLEVLHLLW